MGSKGCFGVHLVALKLLLIAYYGARACLLPLQPAHLKKTGFNSQEVELITLVVPPITIVGPILFGSFADYFRRHKKLLCSFAILMTCLSVTVLVMIPPIYRPIPHKPRMNLLCGDTGSAIQVESCYDSCNVAKRHSDLKLLSVSNCHSKCNITYPHFCFNKNDQANDTDCFVFSPLVKPEVFNISSVLKRYNEKDDHCLYPLLQFFSGENVEYSSLMCRNHDDCLMVCDIDEGSSSSPAFNDKVCDTDMSQVVFRKWLYVVFLGLSEMFLFTVAALLDSVVLLLLRRDSEGYGVQIMFGLLAMGLFGPLCGYLIYSKTGLLGHSELYPPLMACDILLLIAAGMAMSLPNPSDIQYNAVRLTKSHPWRIAGGLTAALFLGILYGGLSWHVAPTLGPPYYVEAVAGAILGALLVPFTYKVIDVCGTGNLLSMCMAAYCVRYVVYLIAAEAPWIPLVMALMESVTLWVPLTSLVILINHSTTYWNTLLLGLLYSIHFGIGRSSGVVFFYYLSQWLDKSMSLKIGSVLSALFGLITLASYYFWLRRRSRKAYPYKNASENDQKKNGKYLALVEKPTNNGTGMEYKPINGVT